MNTNHILLVEDNDVARAVLADTLTDAGHYVTQACDGKQAIELLTNSQKQQRPFDLVVTDMRMSPVNGLEVLHVARQQSHPPLVILLTGYGSLDTALTAFRSGVYDYLLKPCNPVDLLHCVNRALRQRAEEARRAWAVALVLEGVTHLRQDMPEAEAVGQPRMTMMQPTERFMQVGPLCIDRYRHIVLLYDEVMHVTPIEYSLLYILVEAQGQPVAYTEIVARTHNQQISDRHEAFTMLKQHVSNLRHKLPPDMLRNKREVGYMLSEPERSLDISA